MYAPEAMQLAKLLALAAATALLVPPPAARADPPGKESRVVPPAIWWSGLGRVSEYEDWLNGSLVCAPAVVLPWAAELHHYLCSFRPPCALLASAVVFCVALVCRSIDLVVCRQFLIGTHFLWHLLNGVVVDLAMWVIVAVWADRRDIADEPASA